MRKTVEGFLSKGKRAATMVGKFNKNVTGLTVATDTVHAGIWRQAFDSGKQTEPLLTCQMCVFMYKRIITLSLLSLTQYKFEAKLQLGVRGGKRVNRVESIITLGVEHAGRQIEHEVFLPDGKPRGTASSRQGRYPPTLQGNFKTFKCGQSAGLNESF